MRTSFSWSVAIFATAIVFVAHTNIGFAADADDNKSLAFEFPVPSRIQALPDYAVSRMASLMEKFSDEESSHSYSDARKTLDEMTDLYRQFVNDDNYLIHSMRSLRTWHDWYSGLANDQQIVYSKFTDRFRDARQLLDQHNYESAAGNFRELEHMLVDLNEPAYVDQIEVVVSLADAELRCERHAEAVANSRKAYKLACRCEGELSPSSAEALFILGDAHCAAGQYYDSIRELSRACRIGIACFGDFTNAPTEKDRYISAITWSATAFLEVGDYQQASRCLEEVSKLAGDTVTGSKICRLLSYEYCVLDAQYRLPEALEKSQAWLEFAQKLSPPDDEEVLNAKSARAETFLKLGQIDKATPLIDDVVAH